MRGPLKDFQPFYPQSWRQLFCHSLAEIRSSDWFSCAHGASWMYSLFIFLQRNTVIWEIPGWAIFCCSTFDHQCRQYRYLVILPYDRILRSSAGWSLHVRCFLRCNSFVLTLLHLSWTTAANCDMDSVCLGYMSISISSLSGGSAWKNLEIKDKWTAWVFNFS